MRAARTETPRDCKVWTQALKAKYDGEGRPFDRKDWDMLLGHCQAVCDFPAAAFAPELIAAYPGAKVVLTVRDVDAWHVSTSKTIDRMVHDREFEWLSRFGWVFGVWRPMLVMLWDRFFRGDFQKEGRNVYEAHYAAVRRLVPPERLLEYSIEEGWEPLCKFLGEEIPDMPFLKANSADEFVDRMIGRHTAKLTQLRRRALLAVSGLVVLGISCMVSIHFKPFSHWSTMTRYTIL